MSAFHLNTVTLAAADDAYVCLGFAVLLVPIALIVIAAVELHKLKKAVRQLGLRVGELESGRGGVAVAPAAPSAPIPSTTVLPTQALQVPRVLSHRRPFHHRCHRGRQFQSLRFPRSQR